VYSKRHGLDAVGRLSAVIHHCGESFADEVREGGAIERMGGDAQESVSLVKEPFQVLQERNALVAARAGAGGGPVGGHAAHVAGHGRDGHPVLAGEGVPVLQQVGSRPGPALAALDGAG
jgi:hypothetical protein